MLQGQFQMDAWERQKPQAGKVVMQGRGLDYLPRRTAALWNVSCPPVSFLHLWEAVHLTCALTWNHPCRRRVLFAEESEGMSSDALTL